MFFENNHDVPKLFEKNGEYIVMLLEKKNVVTLLYKLCEMAHTTLFEEFQMFSIVGMANNFRNGTKSMMALLHNLTNLKVQLAKSHEYAHGQCMLCYHRDICSKSTLPN